MASVGWTEAAMLFGIVGSCVVLVVLLVKAAHVSSARSH